MLGEVERVACFTGKLSHLEIETEDTAAILLYFRCSAIGEVHLDYVQRAYSRTCHIIGDGGTILWDYTAGDVRWYSASKKEWQVFHNPPGWEPNQMYKDEMQHFLRCLAGNEEPALDVFEAARVLDVALAAKDSATSGCVKAIGASL
jgi:predicted dehydrogenase